MIENKYANFLKSKGVTRLVHFTKSRNIPFLLGSFDDSNERVGVLANNFIGDKSFHEKNDVNRYDKREDFICCSVQYPNFYYFKSATERAIEGNFNDWVILEIDPEVLNKDCECCPLNAATERGKHIKSIDYLDTLFASHVKSKNKNFYRNYNHLSNAPTNVQAEILVKEFIDKQYITGLIFPTKEISELEIIRMELAGIDYNHLDIKYSKELFEKDTVSKIWQGKEIEEISI